MRFTWDPKKSTLPDKKRQQFPPTAEYKRFIDNYLTN